jgi:putative membrane protein
VTTNRPRAFRLAPARTEPAPPDAAPHAHEIAGIAPDNSLEDLLEEEGGRAAAAAPVPPRRRPPFLRLGTILASAFSGLVLIAALTSIERFVSSLFRHSSWLGSLALLLACMAGLAVIGLAARELLAILRQRHILDLRRRADALRQGRDVAAGAALVAELCGLYAHRTDTAPARRHLESLNRDVIDPIDRIAVAERELMGPLDAQAQSLIAGAAQRVSIVTAIMPRAVFDIVFVAGQSLWLIRRVAEIYGSRPGFIGFLSLARRVLSHLTVTGGVAVGDSLVQQLFGHGIAARLSAKLGEGVLNGLLTARVGLAAIETLRPLPFVALSAPRLKDVAGALLQRKEGEEEDTPSGH